MSAQKVKKTDNQKHNTSHLAPYQWQKGQSGNPKGRPPEKTLKEYVRDMLQRMTDEERDAFLVGMPKEVIWRMGEGNPHQTEDSTVTHVVPVPILGGLSQEKIETVQHTEIDSPHTPTPVMSGSLESEVTGSETHKIVAPPLLDSKEIL